MTVSFRIGVTLVVHGHGLLKHFILILLFIHFAYPSSRHFLYSLYIHLYSQLSKSLYLQRCLVDLLLSFLIHCYRPYSEFNYAFLLIHFLFDCIILPFNRVAGYAALLSSFSTLRNIGTCLRFRRRKVALRRTDLQPDSSHSYPVIIRPRYNTNVPTRCLNMMTNYHKAKRSV
ncbi:hypothetical protein BJX61DRAFT_407764 [Aspergillus egyptiacus]|nr:hypothetical protein BJX61DRAFT_407764 [Aspergillus egyptiacus]